jgi:hypothetical protein
MAYDSADRIIEREAFVTAGGAATTVYGKNRSFADRLLKRVRCTIATAGTAAGHGFDIYIGTASVGTFALGTGLADVESTVTLNLAVPAGVLVSAKSLADIVGKADLVFEFGNTSD